MKKLLTIAALSLFNLALPIQQGESSAVNPEYFKLAFKQPDASHVIKRITHQKSKVEFLDGSIWQVPRCYSQKICEWRPGDTVLVTQNGCTYAYNLQNLTAENKAPANLYLGPARNNCRTHVIDSINYSTGQIILNNGTFWEIAPSDVNIFDKWQPNDLVIIGSNEGHAFSSYKYILINTNSNFNEFIRAQNLSLYPTQTQQNL